MGSCLTPPACQFFRMTPLTKLKLKLNGLFRANGITLKHGEKFHHDFDVKHIASVEAKQLKVSREIETLEEKKKTFPRIFKETMYQRKEN